MAPGGVGGVTATFDAYATDRTDARFTDWLRARSEPDWTDAVEHRFVHELADGTVDDAVFRRYLVKITRLCGRSPACSATRSVKRRLWTPRPR